ncbi:unnamed protein product [Mucor fragilis]
MESSSVFDSRRKSSSATIVPPAHSKYNARKASLIPLKISTAGTKNLFYDTGSMAEISPTTVVSFKEAAQDQQPKPSWIHAFKQKLKLKKTTTENNVHFADTQHPEKQHRQHPHQSSRIVHHSYSDPRLSPGSTAVGDDDEEQQGYFSAVPVKKTKRTPRGWVAAVLMIVFGALIAVTFVLVGLGKALSGSSNVASVQSNSTTTATASTTSSTVAAVTDQHLSMSASVSNTEATVTVTKAIALVHKVIKPTAIST